MSFIGKLKIGTEVLVTNTPKFVDKKATVMFVGKLPGGGKNQEFIGVELETPDGSHSGQFQGKQYFKAKQNHGMFAKPKAVKLSDGTPLSTLLTAPSTATKTATGKTTTTQAKTTTTTKAPVSSKKQPETKTAIDQNKLSDQLKQLELNQEIQTLKQQLEQSKKKIQSLQSTDVQQQISAMRQRIRELQDENRMLKVQQEKAKLQTSQNSEQKTKQLQQKIDFFNNQKQFHQKQKSQLKKKILRLQEELDSYEGNLQEFQKLTFKVQNLQAKNAKLREELEQAKTEVRNNQMLTGKTGKQSTGEESKLQQLQENIKILNETITLLEGDLNEEKEKSLGLQKQLETIKVKGGDVTKLEKKLKARDQQLQALKAQLEASADAATFAEKLTLDLLRKEQQLKQSNSKLSEYLNQIQALELQVSESKQMIDLQTAQLQSQQEQIQKHLNQKQQQQLHIGELNKQIAKYKSKIAQLAQNNQSLLMTNSQIMDQTVDQNDLMRQFVSGDVYQHRYFETLKTVQQLSQKYFELELQSSRIKNIVGVQMLNLVETIPQGYTQQFYPQIVKIVIDLKSANDKLYLLFDAASSYLRTRGDIYSRDNIQKAKWLVMLMQQIPLLYGQLTKIELSITTAQTQQEITDIVSNIAIKDLLRKIDYHSSQLLHRFAADNIDASIDLQPFIEPVQTLDNICAQGRKLQYEHETRNKLCVQTMAGAQKIFAVILALKQESELKENAQVDTMLESFLKMLLQYLKQCCNNPQLRIKTETKGYLSGLQFVIKILEQIELNQVINQLSSLYSQVEQIKMLKDTLLTTQFHLKELINDLGQIVYTNELAKIKCNLPGKVWVERSTNINKELNRVQELLNEKQQLSTNLLEAKKKIIILQKQIKDRQATKQLYQKRIGQLQLKVQQSSTYEVQNKRYQQKLRSYEDTNKLIEDELQSQVSKRKQLEQEVRKIKEKLHTLQTQGSGKGKQKKITTLASSSSSEEMTSLGLFKNVLKQCDFLKTIELKKKILQIKQSPLIAKLNEPSVKQVVADSQVKTATQNIRRKAIDAMCQMKIIDPRIKDHKEKSSLINSNLFLKSLQMQVEKQNYVNPNPEQKPKQEIVEMKIGSFFLKNRSTQLNTKLNVGNFKIMSF